MRAIVGLVAALLTCGCAGVARVEPGPAPAPSPIFPEYRIVVHANGSGDIQSFISVAPASAFFKWSGNGTLEARITATGVVLYLDGDSTWVVTPAPGLEAEAQQAVLMGLVVIRRHGQPAGLYAPPRLMRVADPQRPPEPVAAMPGDECDDVDVFLCGSKGCRVPGR